MAKWKSLYRNPNHLPPNKPLHLTPHCARASLHLSPLHLTVMPYAAVVCGRESE